MFSYILDSEDDDEDIAVHRKPHRNAIRDSDSEEDEAAADNSACMAEALVLSASSGEEEANEEKARGPLKSKRISQAPTDSYDSEPEKCEDVEVQQQQGGQGVKSNKKQKEREKSQRHREKKEKRSKAMDKLKKKKKDRFADVSGVGETSFVCFLNVRCCFVLVNWPPASKQNNVVGLHLT